MIPLSIVPQLEDLLANHSGEKSRIDGCRMLGGGSINEACRLQFGQHTYFVKWNQAARYPGMFEGEAKGLALLSKSNTLQIPEVVGTGASSSHAFLVLSYVQQGSATEAFWESFGKGLAQIHRQTATSFGLDHDNYIGSLRQYNKPMSDWPGFFIEQRLIPQIKLARDNGLAGHQLVAAFESLFNKLPDLFPKEPPSLLHGDLWSGNFISSNQGNAVLIDPAVYYGHREMDMGMSKLFGGFHQRFYDAYNDHWRLENGWQQRVDLCNLYPLMVHVNLFGGSYLMQVKSILRSLV
jgi:protein-ribulosamine 3-kinase